MKIQIYYTNNNKKLESYHNNYNKTNKILISKIKIYQFKVSKCFRIKIILIYYNRLKLKKIILQIKENNNS